MLKAGLVETKEELVQIHRLNGENLKQHLTAEELKEEGFVTWLYSLELLEQLHQLAPSVVVKDGERVVGYALTTLREAATFQTDLEEMFANFSKVTYKGKSLFDYRFYCMGQICVDKAYRGKGIVGMLYQKHKEVYGPQYDFILTEISTANPRSQKAHERVGFRTIYQHVDAMDEWNVVVWDWS